MVLRKSAELFIGSCAVYLGVVACGSSGGAPQKVASTGGETATGGRDRGGSGGATTGGSEAGFGFGGIPDPTPDAGAAEAGDGPGPTVCDCPKPPDPPDPYVPPEPLVVEAECDVVVEANANLDYVYAKIPRPHGMTDEQIIRGSAMLTLPTAPSYLPPGAFTRVAGGLSVSDDEVLANCGSIGASLPAPATGVKFIFPR